MSPPDTHDKVAQDQATHDTDAHDAGTQAKPKTITIDIVSDTVCPWCFVGKRRLEQALARLPEGVDVRIGWRPFQLNPDMPREGKDRREHLAKKFGDGDRAKEIYQQVQAAGESVGLAFNFGAVARQPNTVDSHRLIDRAGRDGKQDAVVEALFQAYFMDGKDIGNVDMLVAVAEQAGMDGAAVRAYLSSDEDRERIEAEDQMARRMGVQGVPCFILNRQFAVSGAQDSDVFLQAFEYVLSDKAQADLAQEHEHVHGPGCNH